MRSFLSWAAGQLIDRTDRRETQSLSALWRPGDIGDYFIDLGGKMNVPGDAPEHGPQLRAANPVSMSQLALALYQRYRRGGSSLDRESFLRLADSLVETQCIAEGPRKGAWLYTEPGPYPCSSPWVSAMAQGLAISVLLRARAMTAHGGKYEATARLACLPFRYSVAEGGVVVENRGGLLSLEEYPSCPPSHVLNGWVFALMGLREYADAFGDSWAQEVAGRSLHGLAAVLPSYDVGYWSRYDLFPGFSIRFLASRFYHRLHIAQLRALHAMTGNTLFSDCATRWRKYAEDARCRFRYSVHRLAFKAYCLATGR